MFDTSEALIHCLKPIENELRGLRGEMSSFVREFERDRLNAEFRFAIGVILFIFLLAIVATVGKRLHDSVAHLCTNTQANQISGEPPQP